MLCVAVCSAFWLVWHVDLTIPPDLRMFCVSVVDWFCALAPPGVSMTILSSLWCEALTTSYHVMTATHHREQLPLISFDILRPPTLSCSVSRLFPLFTAAAAAAAAAAAGGAYVRLFRTRP